MSTGPSPVISEATEPSLIPTDSSVLASRSTSDVRPWTVLAR
jgi:hypothetical protein